MKRKRIPNGKNTLSFSPRLQWIFRVAKAALERKGGLFIGLARKASRWKRSPEKVIPSDEPMVPPAERRIIRSLIEANIAVEP
jgi:hypothetical protein